MAGLVPAISLMVAPRVAYRDRRDEPGDDNQRFDVHMEPSEPCSIGARYRAVDHETRIWTLIEDTGVGMLTTRFDGGLRARPLEPRPDRAAGVIYFITDARGLKGDEIEADPHVCFALINAHDKAYLSLTAHASVLRD